MLNEHINSTLAQERDGGFEELQLQGRRLFNLVEAVKLHVEEQLLQLGEVVGDIVEGADSTEHVWHSCQLESRYLDQPA